MGKILAFMNAAFLRGTFLLFTRWELSFKKGRKITGLLSRAGAIISYQFGALLMEFIRPIIIQTVLLFLEEITYVAA